MTQSHNTITKLKSQYMKNHEIEMKIQQRRKRRLMQRLIIAIVVMLGLTGFLLHYHFEQRAVYAEKQQQYEELKNEMNLLKIEEKHLQEEIKLLQDKDYVLELARSNYFLSKKGELIFQVQE